MAAGLAAVRAYRGEHLFERARTIEGWLREGLSRLRQRSPLVGEVRGIGAFFGVELVEDRESRKPLVPWHGGKPGVMKTLFAGLLRRGVYAFGKYNVILVAPPLTIAKDDLDRGLEALGDAVAEMSPSAGA